MRVKRYPSPRRGAQECAVRRIEPHKLKMKKCAVKIRQLKKSDFGECSKMSELEPLGAIKQDNKVRRSLPQNTSSSSIKDNILKPFNTVLHLGNVSFTSNDPFLKLSEKENVPKIAKRITRSYGRKDIYEFISQSEEDTDPTVDVVKKIIKEGRAKLVKRKHGTNILKRKPRLKSISQYLKSLEQYRLRNYKKVLKERKSNSQGAWNQTLWDISLRNVSSTDDSKHERNLDLSERNEPTSSKAVADLTDNAQKNSADASSSTDKNAEMVQNSTSEKIKILEVIVLPNKATIKPTVSSREDKKSEEAIHSNTATEENSEEICDTAEMPRHESPSFDYPDENLSNQNDNLLNEQPDYVNLSTIDEPSLVEMESSSIDANSAVETPDPKPITSEISFNDEPSFAEKDSFYLEADAETNLETYEPKSTVAPTDSRSMEAKTPVKTAEPKPTRKAFWEIEDPEEMLDKSLIKKTYRGPKKKERRTHYFIFFSDDEDSKKSREGTKENISEYYTRSKIQNWIESTKSKTHKDDKLDGKKTNKSKKPILKIQNKISDNDGIKFKLPLKTQQKLTREKNKVVTKVKAEKYISTSLEERNKVAKIKTEKYISTSDRRSSRTSRKLRSLRV